MANSKMAAWERYYYSSSDAEREEKRRKSLAESKQQAQMAAQQRATRLGMDYDSYTDTMKTPAGAKALREREMHQESVLRSQAEKTKNKTVQVLSQAKRAATEKATQATRAPLASLLSVRQQTGTESRTDQTADQAQASIRAKRTPEQIREAYAQAQQQRVEENLASAPSLLTREQQKAATDWARWNEEFSAQAARSGMTESEYLKQHPEVAAELEELQTDTLKSAGLSSIPAAERLEAAAEQGNAASKDSARQEYRDNTKKADRYRTYLSLVEEMAERNGQTVEDYLQGDGAEYAQLLETDSELQEARAVYEAQQRGESLSPALDAIQKRQLDEYQGTGSTLESEEALALISQGRTGEWLKLWNDVYTRTAQAYMNKAEQLKMMRMSGEASDSAIQTAEGELDELDRELTNLKAVSVLGRSDYAEKSQTNAALYAADANYWAVNNPSQSRDITVDERAELPSELNAGWVNDQERGIYNYLYATEGQQAAQEYLHSLANRLQYRKAMAQEAEAVTTAEEHPVLSSVGSIAASPLEIPAAVLTAGAAITGQEVNPYSDIYSPTRYKNSIRGTVSENIDNPMLNLLYNAGMSMGDNALALAMTGGMSGLASLQMSASAMGATAYDTMIRGGSTKDAALAGGAAAITEWLTEKAGFDRITKSWTLGSNALGYKGALAQFVKGFIPEGLEEVPGNFVEAAVDDYLMGGNSQRNQRISSLMAEGMTLDQAMSQADAEFVGDTVMSFLAGGLAGGTMESGSYIGGVYQGRSAAKADAKALAQSTGADRKTLQRALEMDYGVRKVDENLIERANSQIEEAAETAAHATARAAATVNNTDATVTGLTFTSEGAQAVLQGEDGTQRHVPLADVEFENREMQEVYQAASRYEEDGAATAFLSGWEKSRDTLDNYRRGFEAAYTAGYTNRPLTGSARTWTDAMDKTAYNAAYKAGRAAQQAQEARLDMDDDVSSVVRKAVMQMPREAMEGYTGAVNRVSGKLTSFQASQMAVADWLGRKFGVVYTFVDSGTDITGKSSMAAEGVQGAYTTGSNQMVIAVNAQESALLSVAGHETLHYVKEWAGRNETTRAMYDDFQTFVLDRLRSVEGYDLEARIAEKQEQYRQAGQDLDRDSAIEEITADGMATVFATEQNVRDFLESHDQTIVDRVISAIRRLVKEIKAAIQRIAKNNAEAAALMQQDADTLQEISERFDRLAVMAGVVRESVENQETQTSAEGTKYQLKPYSDHQRENWKNSKLIQIYENEQQLRAFVEKALKDPSFNAKMYFGQVAGKLSEDIYFATGVHTEGMNLTIHTDEIRKIFKDHGNPKKESLRGQRAIGVNDFSKIMHIVQDADSISLSDNDYFGNPVIVFAKEVDGKMTAVTYASSKHKDLRVQTLYSAQTKKSLATATDDQASVNTPKATRGTAPDTSIPPSPGNSNPSQKFSLKEIGGKSVVWMEENILDGKPAEQKNVSFIRDYLIGHIDDVYTIIESGSKVYPAKKLPDEYLHSRYSQRLSRMNRTLFKNKLKMVPGIGEMIEIASNRRWEKARHTHNKNARYGVYRYDTRIAFPDGDRVDAYTAELVILNADDGRKYLYDIVNIKKDDVTANGLMDKARWGGKTAQQTNIVTTSIPQLSAFDNPSAEEKFSLRDVDTQNDEMARMLAENDDMLKMARELGSMIRHNPDVHAVHARIQGMAKQFKEETGTEVPLLTLTENLEKAFSAMAKASDDAQIAAAQQMLGSIAKDMLEKSPGVNRDLYNGYEEMRKRLHGGIRLTKNQWQEVKRRYGGNREFRRAIAGLGLKILPESSEGSTLDSNWGELCASWPEFFKLDTAEGDQVEAVVAAITAVQPTFDNEHGLTLEQYASGIALRMQEEYANLPEEGRKDNLGQLSQHAQIAQDIRRIRGKIVREQQDINSMGHLEAKVKAYRDLALGMTEADKRRLDTFKKAESVQTMRGQIIRQKNQLLRRLAGPVSGVFIPDRMRNSVTALLECIDFEGKMTGEKTKTLSAERLLRAKDAYLALEKEDDANGGMKKNNQENFKAYVNEDLAKDFDLLIAEADGMVAHHLSETHTEALRNIVAGFWAAVENANRNFMDERKNTLIESGDMMMLQLSKRKEHRVQIGLVDGFNKIFSKGMLKPETVMHMLDGTELGLAMRILRKAEGRHINQVTEAERYLEAKAKQYDMQESLRTEGGLLKRGKEEVIELSPLDGSTPRQIRLTDQERMSIYAIWKREQKVGTNHLLGNGITLKNAAAGSSQAAIRLTEQDLKNIIGTLTESEKAYVDDMVKFLSVDCAAWGNEVTRKLYGVDKFKEDYYIPFEVNKKYTQMAPGKQQDERLKVSSHTKSLTVGARATIELRPFTELWCSHVEKMSDYAAFVLPIEDVTRLLNYKQDGVTVRAMMDRAYGKHVNAWLEQFLGNLNGNARMEDGGNLINKLAGKAKGAAVAANLSVAVQQFGSAPRAMAEINPKYFMPGGPKAFLHKGSVWASYDECKQYAPIAVLKDWGYFDTNMTQGLYRRAQNKRMDKLNDIASIGAATGDKVTWAWIWEAVKLEVADTRKDLVKGSKEYFEVCADRFTEVIDRTQVVDSIFQRAQFATETGMMRTWTAFMSEPFAMYNMIYRALWDIGQTNGKARIRAVGNFAKVTAIVGINAALTAALKSFISALRDRDNEKKDEEGNIVGVRGYWDKYRDSFGGNVWENITGIGNIVTNAIESARTYAGGGDLATQWIGYLDGFIGEMAKFFDGNDETEGDVEKAIYRLTQFVSSTTGMGFSGAWREFTSIYHHVDELINRDMLAGSAWDTSLPFETRLAAAENNYVMKKQPGDKRKQNTGIYYDLMLAAYYDGGLGEDYEAAVNAAIRTGGGAGIKDTFKKHLRTAEDRIPQAAQALIDGDMDTYAQLYSELAEGEIGERAIVSMILSEYTALLPDEEEEEYISAESIRAELERDDVYQDPVSKAGSEAFDAAVAAESPEKLKAAIDMLRKNGATDAELRNKVRDAYRKEYRQAVWRGDTQTALKLAGMMKGAGVNIGNDDLKEWSAGLSDQGINTEWYGYMKDGDGKSAHMIHKYLVEANGTEAVNAKLKKWCKSSIRGTEHEPNVRSALRQMGYAQETIDGWFK